MQCLPEMSLGFAVTRIWTVFEQFTAAKLGVDVKMILPPESMQSIQAVIGSGNVHFVKENLTQIDVESAKASVPEDETKVKLLIQKHSSFDSVNEAVKKSMRKCCATAFEELLKVQTLALHCCFQFLLILL